MGNWGLAYLKNEEKKVTERKFHYGKEDVEVRKEE